MWPEAMGHLEPPRRGRAKKNDPPLEPPEGMWAYPHVNFRLWPSELLEKTFPLFKGCGPLFLHP